MTIASVFDEAPDREQGPAVLRTIGGVAVAALDRRGALAIIGNAMHERRHLKLAFCNANLVNLAWRDRELRRQLAGFLILPDGLGIDIGSRILHGASFLDNLNGTDFVPALLAATAKPLSVMLLGGRPEIAERAAARLAAENPQHRISVLSHGYFQPEDEAGLRGRLAAERPDLLLVAQGNPRQERWIASLDPSHASVAAGVGALFDFLAGEVPRAPALLRRLRLEWLYRLCLEPARLWRRYVLGNPLFVVRMIRLRLTGRLGPR